MRSPLTSNADLARPALAAMGIGVLAVVLRFYGIADKSIWLDEAWSWRAARLPIDAMVDWTSQDKHPPLYYGVLHFWIDVFGDRETGLRSLSAVAGAITAAALAGVGWRIAGWPLAVLAGALMTAHPTAIEFSQEARMYPLAGMFGLLATIALAANISRPSIPRAVLYAALATAAVYTHYSAFLLVAVHAVLALSCSATGWSVDGRKLAMMAGVSFALIAAAYIPWYGNLINHSREGVEHLPDPSWQLVDLVLSALLGLQWLSDAWLAVAIPLVGFGAWGLRKRIGDPYAICVAAIVLVPCAQLFISVVRTPVFDPRQTSPYIAGFAFVLALGLMELGAYVADLVSRRAFQVPLAITGAAALSAVMLLGVRDWTVRGPREDWRAAAREVDAVSGPVYIWRGYIDEPLRYYTSRVLLPRAPGGPRLLVADGQPATLVLSHESADERASLLRDYGAAYVVGEAITYEGIVIFPLSPRAP